VCAALPTLSAEGANGKKMQQAAHSWSLTGAGLVIAESHALWQGRRLALMLLLLLLLLPPLLLWGMPPLPPVLRAQKSLQCSVPILRVVEGCLLPGDAAAGYQGTPIASAD